MKQKKLREERDQGRATLNHNNEEITRLNSVINNPHSTNEEKENARKQIVILENENKDIKNKRSDSHDKLNNMQITSLKSLNIP
jgi:hypothetical protein